MMKLKDNKGIPSIDVLVSKKSNGSLSHQVYCNETHIDHYLHVNSHY